MAPEKTENTSSILKEIHSKDHEHMLDVIDKLRSQGISQYINLPQIVVCGDQSSGKSSTLEALSGLRFPTKDALCTRFGTELVLRRSPKVSASVTIIPDVTRTDEEKKRLQDFRYSGDVANEIGSIIDQAGQAMGISANKNFSSDILHIELSGPKQPHLTLVDLPGVFHSASKGQSDEDSEAVKIIVKKYIQEERSIVLAVVSAKNDFNNQIVTKFIKDFGSISRVLALVTKPDTLPVGSDSEQEFLNLIQNTDFTYLHGWHVVMNRDFANRHASDEARDLAEKNFFSQGVWASLPRYQVGINALRSRLSRVLQAQISQELPSLIKEVNAGIQDCKTRLALLGAPRSTISDQRKYIFTISQTFTKYIKEAVDGRYNDPFFGDATEPETCSNRIRAVVNNQISTFRDEVEQNGHKYQIVAVPPEIPSDGPPYKVTREERLAEIKEVIDWNRGTELSTMLKEEVVTSLFKTQCSPWSNIVRSHADIIFDKVNTFMNSALEACCDQKTREGIMSHILAPGMDRLREEFQKGI